MIHRDSATLSFFTDSISLGNLRREIIHSGSILSPEKPSWCQKYRQVAYKGEWTKISADGKHPSVVTEGSRGLNQLVSWSQQMQPFTWLTQQNTIVHSCSLVSFSFPVPPDECGPARWLHRDPHWHFSFSALGCGHLCSGPGSKVRHMKALGTFPKLLLFYILLLSECLITA